MENYTKPIRIWLATRVVALLAVMKPIGILMGNTTPQIGRVIDMEPMERVLLGEKPKIKFSHEYYKLPTSKCATLIICKEIDLESQTEHFKNYDTAFGSEPELYEPLHYPLPKKGNYLLLAFISDTGAFFTTLRRATPQKTKYYESLVGREFEVVIKEVGE